MKERLERIQDFADRMHHLGDAMAEFLNKPYQEKQLGFFLVAFRLGKPGKPVSFLCDGAEPAEIIEMLKEAVRRLEAEQQTKRTMQ